MIVTLCKERDSYGDSSVKEFVNLIKDVSADEIVNNSGFYHRHCYTNFGNVEKRDRALSR